jgi:hypothetical protein
MAIRKFIEEIGEKVLPPRRGKSFRNAPQQQQQFAGGTRQQQSSASTLPEPVLGGELSEASEAIRRHIASRRGFVAPSDLVVLFNEDDGVVVLGGTVRDEETRELVIRTAGNIQGVERVDDRMAMLEVDGWR